VLLDATEVATMSGRYRGGASAGGRLIPRRELFDRLADAGRVTVISAPAGSGKTSLVRSWIADADLEEQTAWVSVGREERDPSVFWLSVLDALRSTPAGRGLVRELTAGPDLDGWMIVERLLVDLSSLEEPLLLCLDDLHELRASEAMPQMELLLRGAPVELRFALLTRSDLRLGLHRMRLEEQVTELRRVDLGFTVAESRTLLESAGVELSEGSLESLVRATEGWAAGLRLAVLSLARHPDPERFASGFSGRERTVAEYLLAEVLEHQTAEVSKLLLRTSVLERVSGPLADRLCGSSGSERVLSELEEAGVFVVALDPERRWFRYHRLFGDLLALELRRTAPQELSGLHTAAAEWFSEHGHPIEAIRHVQATENWGLAARLLADHWFRLELDGRRATARALLAAFPAGTVALDPELAVLAVADARGSRSLDDVERYLALATDRLPAAPEDRQGRLHVALGLVRLWLARARHDREAVADEARRLLAPAEAREAVELGIGGDLRAIALTAVGIAEIGNGRFEDADRHLERALAEARRISRPILELQALANWAFVGGILSQAVGETRALEAVELAHKHGWAQDSPVAGAYLILATMKVWRGRLDEAEPWVREAERALQSECEPSMAITLHGIRALLDFAHGRHQRALTGVRAAESIEALLVPHNVLGTRVRAYRLKLQVHLGETDQVERALAAMDEQERERCEMRVILGWLRLAQGDLEAAAAALLPIIDRSTTGQDPKWEIHALVLQAMVSEALRDPGGASRALERALEIAEPQRLLLAFLLAPIEGLLERHAQLHTAHAPLISEILAISSGRTPAPEPGDVEPLLEPLSESELRVLRYLPTRLQGPEIAGELYVSVNTIRTHMRHLYAKLGVHRRVDAVERARQLGLLSPSLRRT
jgi:LuxR family maltose regulon positive regulatory protein